MAMLDVSALLERRLSPGYWSLLARVSEAAADAGVRAYLVGGSVRDMLLGSAPAEMDLAIAGGPDDTLDSLAARLGGAVRSASQFGTAMIESSGILFDVVRTRRESYSRPGALPTVEFTSSIEEDLPRRDFTMNAVAVSLDRDSWGALLDPFDGRRDLEAKQVRVLHPRSFVDDPTRILRAARYAARLGFGFEDETARLLTDGLGYLGAVSGDRIRRELERIFAEDRVAAILELAEERGLPRAIHPALTLGGPLAARLGDGAAPSPAALLAALAFHASDAARDGLAQRMRLVSDWAQAVRGVGKVKARFGPLSRAELDASDLYALMADVHDGAAEACALATDDDCIHQRIQRFRRDLRGVRPILDGRDVMALGVPAGSPVGEMLHALLNARLDGLVSSGEDEKRFVRQRLGAASSTPPSHTRHSTATIAADSKYPPIGGHP